MDKCPCQMQGGVGWQPLTHSLLHTHTHSHTHTSTHPFTHSHKHTSTGSWLLKYTTPSQGRLRQLGIGGRHVKARFCDGHDPHLPERMLQLLAGKYARPNLGLLRIARQGEQKPAGFEQLAIHANNAFFVQLPQDMECLAVIHEVKRVRCKLRRPPNRQAGMISFCWRR